LDIVVGVQQNRGLACRCRFPCQNCRAARLSALPRSSNNPDIADAGIPQQPRYGFGTMVQVRRIKCGPGNPGNFDQFRKVSHSRPKTGFHPVPERTNGNTASDRHAHTLDPRNRSAGSESADAEHRTAGHLTGLPAGTKK
jgi:hypothetical protein